MPICSIEKPLGMGEVSEMTGLSLATLREHIATGRLRAVDISTKERPRYRIMPSALRAFLGEDSPSRDYDDAASQQRRNKQRRLDADIDQKDFQP